MHAEDVGDLAALQATQKPSIPGNSPPKTPPSRLERHFESLVNSVTIHFNDPRAKPATAAAAAPVEASAGGGLPSPPAGGMAAVLALAKGAKADATALSLVTDLRSSLADFKAAAALALGGLDPGSFKVRRKADSQHARRGRAAMSDATAASYRSNATAARAICSPTALVFSFFAPLPPIAATAVSHADANAHNQQLLLIRRHSTLFFISQAGRWMRRA